MAPTPTADTAHSNTNTNTNANVNRAQRMSEKEKQQHTNVNAVDSDEDEEEYVYKIVIVGDGAVGKTSLLHRFVNNMFAQSYKQTIGLDFFSRRLLVPKSGGNIVVNMQLWDIGGQTLGSSMLQTYIFGASAIVFVYDVTNFQSFQNLEDWYDIIEKAFPKAMPYTTIIGNKMDLPHLRVVRTDQHQKFAHENNINAQFLLSAKTNDRIVSSFTLMAAEMIGIVLTSAEKEALETNAGRIMEATIVNHEQHDPDQKPLDLTSKRRNCSIM